MNGLLRSDGGGRYMLWQVSTVVDLETHMKVLQQSSSSIPPPVYSLRQVRCLLQEDGRSCHGAFRRQRQNVDSNFLRVSYRSVPNSSQLSGRRRHSS